MKKSALISLIENIIKKVLTEGSDLIWLSSINAFIDEYSLCLYFRDKNKDIDFSSEVEPNEHEYSKLIKKLVGKDKNTYIELKRNFKS